MKVHFLNRRVEKEFLEFPADMAADYVRTVELMEKYASHNIGMPHVRKIIGTDLWEIRVKGKAGIGRMMYGVNDRALIILHCFIKKTQKTPQQAIELAKQRWKER